MLVQPVALLQLVKDQSSALGHSFAGLQPDLVERRRLEGAVHLFALGVALALRAVGCS